MNEIVKFIFKIVDAISDDRFSILENTVKGLRAIFLIFITYYLYKIVCEDFVIVSSISSLVDFFASAYFLKPLGLFLLVWFIFDILLLVFIKWFFNVLLIDTVVAEAN